MRFVEHSGWAHWRGGIAYPVTHGPKVWPWWRLVVFMAHPLMPFGKGYTRLWVYTRWGAWCVVLKRSKL